MHTHHNKYKKHHSVKHSYHKLNEIKEFDKQARKIIKEHKELMGKLYENKEADVFEELVNKFGFNITWDSDNKH